jgi:hypothetical protein
MQISLSIKDSLYTKELEAVCSMNGYTETDPDGNPITQEQFLKKQIKAWLRNQAVEYANRQVLANVSVEEDA